MHYGRYPDNVFGVAGYRARCTAAGAAIDVEREKVEHAAMWQVHQPKSDGMSRRVRYTTAGTPAKRTKLLTTLHFRQVVNNQVKVEENFVTRVTTA